MAGLLLVDGFEALRRLAAPEFPDSATIEPRELLQPFTRLRLRGGAPAAPADPVDQLERLARLYEECLLNDEELALAKRRVLAPSLPA